MLSEVCGRLLLEVQLWVLMLYLHIGQLKVECVPKSDIWVPACHLSLFLFFFLPNTAGLFTVNKLVSLIRFILLSLILSYCDLSLCVSWTPRCAR